MYTQFDVVTVVAILICVTIGFLMGGIRSTLSLIKWYGALMLSLAFYPYTKSIVEQFMVPSPVVNAIAVVAVYIISLIIFAIINGIIIAALGGTVGGGLDRLLGAGIGFGIAYLLVATVHFAIHTISGKKDPEWLVKGQTYQFTSNGAKFLVENFSEQFNNLQADLGFSVDDMKHAGGEILTDITADLIKYKQARSGLDINSLGLNEGNIENSLNASEKGLNAINTNSENIPKIPNNLSTEQAVSVLNKLNIDENKIISRISELKEIGYESDKIKNLITEEILQNGDI